MTYDNFHAWRKENGLDDLLSAMKYLDGLRASFRANPNEDRRWLEVPVIVRLEFAALYEGIYEGMRALFFG